MPKPKPFYRPLPPLDPVFQTLWFEGSAYDGVYEREVDVLNIGGEFFVFDGSMAITNSKGDPKRYKTLTDAKKAARQYAAGATANWYEGRLPAKALAARKALESKYVKTRRSK
jgi:hypothetical protein